MGYSFRPGTQRHLSFRIRIRSIGATVDRCLVLYVTFLVGTSCGGETRLEGRGSDAAILTDVADAASSGIEAGSDSNAPDGNAFDDDIDAAACYISASNYDQSCSVDSDCVAVIEGAEGGIGAFGLVVQSGNYCQPLCMCGGQAINKGAVAQYVADVSKTPVGSGAIKTPPCFCPSVSPTGCCGDGGRCLDDSCPRRP